MKLKSLSILATLSSLLLSCSHKKVVTFETDKADANKPKGVVTLTIPQVKASKKKFDYQLTVKNETNDFIIIMLNDFACYRGEVEGIAKHTFFNTGERTIDFGPGQSKDFSMVCNFPTRVSSGNFKVEVRRVFDNPKHDRATPGQVIGQNIAWEGSDATAN